MHLTPPPPFHIAYPHVQVAHVQAHHMLPYALLMQGVDADSDSDDIPPELVDVSDNEEGPAPLVQQMAHLYLGHLMDPQEVDMMVDPPAAQAAAPALAPEPGMLEALAVPA